MVGSRQELNALIAPWVGIDFERHPELYRVGRGEQGVLLSEPYKSRLLPLWRFRTPALARQSAALLYMVYQIYRAQNNPVGMDMTRKWEQMGWTRAARYRNHRSGKKYDGPVPAHLRGISGAHGRMILPLDLDPEKGESAEIFKRYYLMIRADPAYQRALAILKANHPPRRINHASP